MFISLVNIILNIAVIGQIELVLTGFVIANREYSARIINKSR